MSFVNVMLVGPDRAFVAVDTIALLSAGKNAGPVMRLGGGLVHATKMIAIPHAGCVIASNGSSLGFELITVACQRTGFSDADEGAALMPEIIRGADQRLRKSGYGELHAGTFLVGWSPRHERMRLDMWWDDESGRTERHQVAPESRGTRLATLIMGAAFSGAWPSTLDEFVDCTRKSVQIEHEKEDPHCVGGTLIVADIGRDSIRLINCGDLGLPPNLPRTSVTNHGLLAALQE